MSVATITSILNQFGLKSAADKGASKQASDPSGAIGPVSATPATSHASGNDFGVVASPGVDGSHDAELRKNVPNSVTNAAKTTNDKPNVPNQVADTNVSGQGKETVPIGVKDPGTTHPAKVAAFKTAADELRATLETYVAEQKQAAAVKAAAPAAQQPASEPAQQANGPTGFTWPAKLEAAGVSHAEVEKIAVDMFATHVNAGMSKEQIAAQMEADGTLLVEVHQKAAADIAAAYNAGRDDADLLLHALKAAADEAAAKEEAAAAGAGEMPPGAMPEAAGAGGAQDPEQEIMALIAELKQQGLSDQEIEQLLMQVLGGAGGGAPAGGGAMPPELAQAPTDKLATDALYNIRAAHFQKNAADKAQCRKAAVDMIVELAQRSRRRQAAK